MEDVPYGKRLKSPVNETLFYRFPGSDTVKTLPAGKPSPVIESFILKDGGYFQLNDGSGENYYLKNSDRLEVVPPDSEDESGLFSGLFSGAADLATNAGKSIKKNAGFVADGFNESVNDLKIAGFEIGADALKYLAIGSGVLIVILTLIAFIKAK